MNREEASLRGCFMIALLLAGCLSGKGETIDIIKGTYLGFPWDGKPVDGVKVEERDSTFQIEFYEHEQELWADLAFDGRMIIYGFVIENEDNTIEGVTVDGVDLACVVFIEGFSFKVEGLFSSDFVSLFLDVQSIGTMTLFLQDSGAA